MTRYIPLYITNHVRLVWLIAVVLSLTHFARAETVTVSAAISMKEALEDVAGAYERETGDKLELSLGSSGQLMAQVERGAPVDVFVSAADEQMDRLSSAKLIADETRAVVAGNRLVLVAPADSAYAPASFRDLGDRRLKRISIGHPQTVPAGAYAAQVLAKLGLSEAVRGRLVYGANVRQVLNYVERGEADAGIVYRTDASSSGARVRVIETADPSWHEPIRYAAAVVSATKKRGAAERFVRFLGGRGAQEILSRRGFEPPPPSPSTKPAS